MGDGLNKLQFHVDEPRETSDPIRKLYGEGRAEEALIHFDEDVEIQAAKIVPLEPSSEMQHVAGSVLRRGRAHANEYGAELVVIAIEREPGPEAALEALPAPGYAFGVATTSDDAETIALALRAIARRLERA